MTLQEEWRFGNLLLASGSKIRAPTVTLAELHVFVLRSFKIFNKASTKFNSLAKTYNGLIEGLL